MKLQYKSIQAPSTRDILNMLRALLHSFCLLYLFLIKFYSFQKMTNSLKYAVLLAVLAVASAEKQIKLEDIERDNLISERQTNGGPRGDPVETEQSQDLRPPSIQTGASYEVNLI